MELKWSVPIEHVIFEVPLVMVDKTQFINLGFVGDDGFDVYIQPEVLESVFALLQESNNNSILGMDDVASKHGSSAKAASTVDCAQILFELIIQPVGFLICLEAIIIKAKIQAL